MTSDSSFPPDSDDLISQLAVTTEQLGAFVASPDPERRSGAEAASFFADTDRLECLADIAMNLLAPRGVSGGPLGVSGVLASN